MVATTPSLFVAGLFEDDYFERELENERERKERILHDSVEGICHCLRFVFRVSFSLFLFPSFLLAIVVAVTPSKRVIVLDLSWMRLGKN